MRAVDDTTLEFYGALVNNALSDVVNGNTNFHSTFINNGIVLVANSDGDGVLDTIYQCPNDLHPLTAQNLG
jgi:hypothetical protein